ncbi:MAG: hypothetical protein WCG29_13865, partial [Desulfomonile sp.]
TCQGFQAGWSGIFKQTEARARSVGSSKQMHWLYPVEIQKKKGKARMYGRNIQAPQAGLS